MTDHYALDDFHALHMARQSVKNLNLRKNTSFVSVLIELLRNSH